MFADDGLSLRAQMKRSDGMWQITVFGPDWAMDDFARELRGNVVLWKANSGGCIDPNSTHSIMFQQKDMVDLLTCRGYTVTRKEG